MAVAIGIGVLGAIFSGNAIDMSFFLRAMANSVDSFTLTAVPFFILAGHIMSEVRRRSKTVSVWMYPILNSLQHLNVF